MNTQPQITVAGHICLDLIPSWPAGTVRLAELLTPGKMTEVGPAVTSTGGVVSNTGLALHRLGVPVQLMGKVGDDAIGRAILDIVARTPTVAAGQPDGKALAASMVVAPGQASSYTVVLNVPGHDRMFLHCPGANHTFCAADVAYDRLAGQRLFHFGYPPAMRSMYSEGGRELETLLRRVKAAGPATSIDMAQVDPATPAGQVDWPALLRRVLPAVDLFLPSLDETLAMVNPGEWKRLQAQLCRQRGGRGDGRHTPRTVGATALMGAAVVGLKLGDQGFYLRTTDRPERLAAMANGRPADPARWLARELLAPCFAVQVAGTTGSGDTTIAGLLAGLLLDLPPEQCLTAAVAVGACSVEQPDATSGVQPWPAVQARIASGWPRRPVALDLPGWRWDEGGGLWRGPADR